MRPTNRRTLQDSKFANDYRNPLIEDKELIGSKQLKTDLVSKNFSARNLSYTDFSGSDLRRSKLMHSCLFSANFLNCNLLGANLGIFSILNQSASCLCFSGDSDFLILGSKSIKILDVNSNKIVQEFEKDPKEVSSLQVFEDGRHLLSSSSDGKITVFDLKTGEKIENMRKTRLGIDSIDIINHLNIYERGISRSNERKEEIKIEIPGPNVKSGNFKFTEDCELVAIPNYFSNVNIFHVQSARNIKDFSIDESKLYLVVETVAFSPSRKFLCVGGKNEIVVWDFYTSQVLSKLEGHRALRNSLHFTHDESFLVFAKEGSIICVFETEKWQIFKQFYIRNARVECFAISFDLRYFAIGNSKSVAIFEFSLDSLSLEFENITEGVGYMKISNDFDLIALVNRFNTLKVYKTSTFELILQVKDPNEITCCDISFDGSFVTIGCNNSFSVWSLIEKTQIQRFEFTRGHIRSIQFSPDGQFVVAVYNKIKIYQLFSDRIHGLQKSGRKPCCITFTPDTQHIIANVNDTDIRMWGLVSMKCMGTFTAANDEISCLSVSNSGLYLASFHYYYALRVWEIDNSSVKDIQCIQRTGFKEIQCIQKTGVVPIKAVFSQDERLIACLASNYLIKIWDVYSGELVYLQHEKLQILKEIKFISTQNTLITYNSQLTVNEWRICRPKYNFKSSTMFMEVYSDKTRNEMKYRASNHSSGLVKL